MKYDIESILEMYEDDYTPRAKVPGPRNMKLAEVPRSEMDNVNTPDLEQSPDSFLKPGETLEDFDVEFRRPNADGGRIPFGNGLSVDPERDSFKKISNVIGAYNRYKRGEKNPKLNFNQFFELYSTENFAEGGRIPFDNGGDAFRLKKLQEDYDNFGKKELNKAAKTLGFKNYESMSGVENSNFRRKIKKELNEYGEVLNRKESDIRGRKKRIKTEQDIQIKLLEETNKKKFFDPEKFAKANKISMKELKAEAVKLRNNIYDKRMLVSGKEMRSTLEWIPDDLKQADNTLNKLWKSKLIANDRGKIENLFYDAFGNPDSPTFNPKKHLAIRNNLTEYYQLRDAIKAKYPNINLALDHPLSKSSLKNLFNASADQLTRVNPLEFDLNNGFKDSLSQQYELSVKNKNANQKKAVEKIARDLKINIGKINKDATNFNYGVKEFQKLNMKDEILKAVQNQADLSSNFKNYVKQNPDLFKTANVNTNTNITKVTQRQVKQVASLLEKLGCGKSAGGRILFSKGTPGASLTECGKKGVSRFIDDLKSGNYSKATKDILKGGGNVIKNIANPMELLKLRNLIGPGALGFMAAFEGGVITDDVIRQGTPLNESLANNWLTKTFLPYTQEYAKAKNLLETGKVPSNMKKYVQDVVTFNESLKDMEGIQGNVDSRLVDVGGYGMGDGTSMYSKQKEDKDVNNLIKKMSTISEDVITQGTGKALEMKALQNEKTATEMAKKEFSPIFGFDKLKDVRTPGSKSFDYIPDETPKDLRPITYKDYEKKELPADERQYYENKYNIKPRSSLSEYYLPGAKVNVLDELTSKYNMREAAKYPGFFSADSEKFSEGGITELKSKYEYKK